MTFRSKAFEIAQGRVAPSLSPPSEKITDLYGSNTFSDDVMKTLLSAEAYTKISNAIRSGSTIDREVADEVSAAMKSWAVSKGATHYTHWFQPLTGTTAEKHDSFFDLTIDGKAVEKFKGSALVQQEPDASSFPSGGLRATFEARGYTGWDPSSPAFLMDNGAGGKTLCIPSVFISYTGEALDYKAPLLKSLVMLDKAATSVCQFFNRDVDKVTPTLGIEQEYFLVDKALYYARPDLLMAGRTVFGHSPARGQQLDDHYFGSISPRVNAFMVDFEFEALKLGIPVRTRHNEVAPGQFECAPTFEEVNLAIDHNALLMDLMQKVGDKHNFQVLFHEKPFAGINGSGKHNNWSLSTDTGINLLAPTSKPKENLRFLTFLMNVVKAVHDHADLLRASISSAGNEHRLGANEAPPSIVSVFLGNELTNMLEELVNKGEITLEKGENFYYKLGITRIPNLQRDNTDRNRTSPFCFTGNKFEYRAVGSSQNSASPMIVLNTIVANQLLEFKKEMDERLAAGEEKKVATVEILKRYFTESKNILFEGNGYSEEWVEEAKNRGLTNIRETYEALHAYKTERTIAAFERMGVLTSRELHARYEIELENYVKKLQIESRVIGDLALNHIVSTVVKYQFKLAQTARSLTDLEMLEEAAPIKEIIKDISTHIVVIKKLVQEMTDQRKTANNIDDLFERAKMYGSEVKGFFEEIRYHVDKLELLIDDEDWPLAKYREMLFLE
ncbi:MULTISPECIES: glutamine synthetase III [Dyadobacter]|uniref:Glutamine synthetase III n=1 Tax=Dyadobacter chenhuakuii TaxID=2909339 RepID=A0A9X1TS15_9BACT|nr:MULTISPECIES: glutamine synthetase III [Dyadobacter]MCE7072432.1 glutamine synthetase III [Dyadobacter sp. CY327]MCF2494518.1 glutamine synthetase III [Dyadobacter chenhuakuii]MCF2497575.1 glutamine synthetase III [Dyadobacter chenhuakuii]MCF2519752.1 glutamine synthetase III [Dyadobacter sp. CY351]USJ32158.1 glutamine synthetase III [Dyadobacter chenhuakuii]